jgi:opacity protein-like surface antigen
MSRIRAILALGAALISGGATVVSAADLSGGMKDSYAPAYAPSPSVAGWYIRGDVGWGTHDNPTMVESGRYDLFDTHIDNTWTLGGGVGRYISKNVRADFTYDHRFEADARGTMAATAGLPFPGGVRDFGLKSDVFLANVYYDFDVNSRFTPYIGIGLGLTRNRTTAGTVTDNCGCDGEIEAASKWSVAGAFMTGVSVNFGQRGGHTYSNSVKDAPVYVDSRGRWNLDAGYRLLYLGEANTGLITSTCCGTSGDPHVRDIWAHELRVDLRMDIR